MFCKAGCFENLDVLKAGYFESWKFFLEDRQLLLPA
jgi:hypothetical protein